MISLSPTGRWFQNDVLDANYRRPQGIQFGLCPFPGWSRKAPMVMEEDEEFESSVRRPPETTTEGRVVNEVVDMEGGHRGWAD